ncbi:GAF and ANTAR domain-containing protein [Streptomyces sp. NPDC003032]
MTAEGPPDPSGIGEQALAQLQALLLDSDRLDDFLQDLVRLTTQLLPMRLSCSITLNPEDRLRTAAASDDMVHRFDQDQYDLGEGPCLATLHSGEAHAITDMRTEERFGSFPARAQAHGILSLLALPLTPPGLGTSGVLNLYASEKDAFPPAVRDQAAVFASYAAGALGVAQKIANQTRFSTDLQAALVSRTVIDQALGIIMGQQRCTAERAFQILGRASQNRNMKLRDVAAGLITQVSGAPPAKSPLRPRTPPSAPGAGER